MNPVFTCECADGRTVVGSAKWQPDELSNMEPLQLAAVVTEQRDFAQYYTSHFFYPLQKLRSELENLLLRYRQTRFRCYLSGIAAAVITVLWLMFAIVPSLRFSGITLFFALMTLGSILVFIPMLLSHLTAQADYEKRRPRARAKMEQLLQKQEQLVYGTYLEYAIGGYLISPEYALQENALDYIVQALKSRRASNLAEANMLCRKKFGKAVIPSVVTRIRPALDTPAAETPKIPDPPRQIPETKKAPQEAANPSDLQDIINLSNALNSALRNYAVSSHSEHSSPAAATLTSDEENFLAEFRSLNAQEQLRIRRIVRSFRTGTI